VQIPFLQEAFKDFSIVPVIVSSNSYVLCEKLADALVKIIGKRNDVLVIASSDMSHYHALDLAKEIDKATLALIENNETEELFNFCAYGKGELCGLGAVTTLMLAMKQLNASKIELLRYATSANTAGSDINRVVGYCSVVFSNEINSDKNPIKRGENMLSNEQRKKILEVARQSMTEYLKTGKRPKTTTTDPLFQELRGAFVTIHKNGALRGCIGRIIADKPLVEVIEDMAIQAATQDPRFPVLETKELEDIDLEISVLTPLKEIDDIKKIEVGKHGLLIRKGFFSGLLLPQVATEYGWTKEEFLEHTCLKAGLEPQAWKNGAQIYIFSAEVFGEKGN
ncbi:MAG: AmmeMemoRadiSam system protein A, partial [Candidatus Omnitrophica bacterium]|nr:AmmeMemoRadiSam system protein A [Candidatus Omnitrophota bacterium]